MYNGEESVVMKNKKKLIVIAGPTASGKSGVAIELAKAINGEVISADSMQVYKQMDIGSAKVTREEMDRVPHHLIDILDPKDTFSVQHFQMLAKDALEKIYAKGAIPIIAGGTGFYIQSVVKDISFSETDEEKKIREHVNTFLQKHGKEKLHQWLSDIDPESGEKIHPNNTKRVQRGIEYFLLTKEKISDHNRREKEKTSPYDVTFIVLTMEREHLYQRIDQRVDHMIEQGLVDEVRHLKEQGHTRDMTSMQGLGYKEILEYLDGECCLDEAIYKIKRDTRHFAKRQLTWFRREEDVHWIEVDKYHFDKKKIVNVLLQEYTCSQ